MSAPLIEARALVRRYAQGRDLLGRPARWQLALDGVSLELAEGDTLGVVGGSGSGKSTLARLLTGHEAPDSGQLLVRAAPDAPQLDLARARGAEKRAARLAVQLVFQDAYASLDPRQTIGAALRELLRVLRVVARAAETAEIERLLAEVGLRDEIAQRLPRELSGGQRQRACLARALAVRPRVLVLDEATSALDPSVQAQILELLARLKRERGLALVFVSHDLALVRWLCARTLVLHEGRAVEAGPTEQLWSAPAHARTRALVAAAR